MQQQSGYLILMYWWERLLWLNSSNINKNKQTAPLLCLWQINKFTVIYRRKNELRHTASFFEINPLSTPLDKPDYANTRGLLSTVNSNIYTKLQLME